MLLIISASCQLCSGAVPFLQYMQILHTDMCTHVGLRNQLQLRCTRTGWRLSAAPEPPRSCVTVIRTWWQYWRMDRPSNRRELLLHLTVIVPYMISCDKLTWLVDFITSSLTQHLKRYIVQPGLEWDQCMFDYTVMKKKQYMIVWTRFSEFKLHCSIFFYFNGGSCDVARDEFWDLTCWQTVDVPLCSPASHQLFLLLFALAGQVQEWVHQSFFHKEMNYKAAVSKSETTCWE